MSPDKYWVSEVGVPQFLQKKERYGAEAAFVKGGYIEPFSGIFTCPDLNEMAELWGNSYAFNAKQVRYLRKPPVARPDILKKVAWFWCNTLTIPPPSGIPTCGAEETVNDLNDSAEIYALVAPVFQRPHGLMSETGCGKNTLYFDGHVSYLTTVCND